MGREHQIRSDQRAGAKGSRFELDDGDGVRVLRIGDSSLDFVAGDPGCASVGAPTGENADDEKREHDRVALNQERSTHARPFGSIRDA